MMMMNCFCGMVDRRKVFRLISTQGHCQRPSPSRISNTPQAGFESAQNLSSGLVEWGCAVVITTTPRRHALFWQRYKNASFYLSHYFEQMFLVLCYHFYTWSLRGIFSVVQYREVNLGTASYLCKRQVF